MLKPTQEPQVLLASLAEVQQRLEDYGESIKHREGVIDASIIRFSPGLMPVTDFLTGEIHKHYGDDFGLSVSMVNGTCIDWWLEVWTTTSEWSLIVKIHQHDPDEDGSHVVVDILDLQTTSFDEFLTSLRIATDQLISAQIPCLHSSPAA
jgi:hypothetical protein